MLKRVLMGIGVLQCLLFSLEVEILNFGGNETIDWSLPLLYGTVDANVNEISVNGVTWPVKEGYFKAFATLKPGSNAIEFEANSEFDQFMIRYQPKTSTHRVRFIWYYGSDEDGSFEAPSGMDNSKEEAGRRLKMAALMMQSFYAESLKRSKKSIENIDVPQKTFRLELDENYEPIVHLVRASSRTGNDLRQENSSSAYGSAHNDARNQLNSSNTDKHATLMAFSNRDHYVDQTARGQGVAWGGGNNGATSGCTMYAWASDLQSLAEAFRNRSAPEAGLCRDWNSGTYMGNYSTTFGGFVHELGHAFGQGHTAYGIMSSEINQIYRWFVIEDVSRNNELVTLENEKNNEWWHPDDIDIYDNTWFQRDPVLPLAYGYTRGSGLQVLGLDQNHLNVFFPKEGEYGISIYSMMGQLMHPVFRGRASFGEVRLPVTPLVSNSGNLIIKVEQMGVVSAFPWNITAQ